MENFIKLLENKRLYLLNIFCKNILNIEIPKKYENKIKNNKNIKEIILSKEISSDLKLTVVINDDAVILNLRCNYLGNIYSDSKIMLIDVLESLSPHFDISFIQKNLELLINSLILFLIKENKIGSFEVIEKI